MKRIAKLEDLTPDPANANEGTLRGTQLLDRSLEKYGAGRSIVVDRNGVVIAGNKTLEQAVARGLRAKVVKTDGSKLVVVQRADLDLEATPAARELAYMDNRVAEVGLKWNPEQIERDLANGIELGGMFTPEELDVVLTDVDTRERSTTLMFDSSEQRDVWMAFVKVVHQRYADKGESLGARLSAWVTERLAEWNTEDPAPVTGDEPLFVPKTPDEAPLSVDSVTPKAIEQAQAKEKARFARKGRDVEDVTCPHCGQSFGIQKTEKRVQTQELTCVHCAKTFVK